jgi:hypothetical protein
MSSQLRAIAMPNEPWAQMVYTGPTAGSHREQTNEERLLCSLADENTALNQLLRFVWDVNKPDLDEDVRKAIRNYYDEKYKGEER